MKKNQLYFLLGITIISSCANNSRNASPQEIQSVSTPVETRKPNSEYQPAFPGQTRIGGVKTGFAYETSIITKDLNKPWGIVSLPDGRFLITEKAGDMKIVTSSGKESLISGIPPVNPLGQGGLLGLTLDPDFSNNRMIYWTFSDVTNEGNLTAVAKGKLSSDESKIEEATIIYRATPAFNSELHYGSRILFDKTGNLIFSTGERSDIITRPQAQQLNSSLGKIIRITTDGKPAPGNPFANNKEAKPELYSYGHRNVQGLAFHPETGDLWECEFGPKGGDELNLIHPGKNYGWPTITYGLEYSGEKVGEGITVKEGLEQPVYYWDPVLSPSGMTFYSGNEMPEWKNNLFICGLNSNHIARLVIENNKVTGEEMLLSDLNQRFRDITQGKDGALYVVTDEGRLYRIGLKSNK
jgi:glucose/arabinose dehydrogenase